MSDIPGQEYCASFGKSVTLKIVTSVTDSPNDGQYSRRRFFCTLPAAATRVVTCDNGENVQFLICDSGVISIERALYGRTDGTTCREGRPANQLTNTQCSQTGTLEVLSQRCNGKQVCEVNTEVFRTSDPCVGIYKYLDTTYTCIPATRSITCEGSDGLLECGVMGRASVTSRRPTLCMEIPVYEPTKKSCTLGLKESSPVKEFRELK
ncbi:L-rhamnose-binding lectin CSL2-like [Oncorhynchus masou masou]|uniref:L-rhamnose-binding lectin CSL2-like n=1 Tax=Oncorhynchus masou masou TaxID=90313 RepID=UPI0031834108